MNQSAEKQHFGTQIAGIPVVIDTDWNAEFFENTEVFPLPSNTKRLIGMVQIRGEVVPVFDPSIEGLLAGNRRRKVSLMTVRNGKETVGFAVDMAPSVLKLGAASYASSPAVPFSAALTQPQLGTVSNKQSLWWQMDLTTFFDSLSKPN